MTPRRVKAQPQLATEEKSAIVPPLHPVRVIQGAIILSDSARDQPSRQLAASNRGAYHQACGSKNSYLDNTQ
jgi:hypothetical protein